MTYSNTSLIHSDGQSTAAQIDRWFAERGQRMAAGYAPDGRYVPAPADLGRLIIEEARHWPQHAVNHDLLAAQISHECAAWQSEYARFRNNPSGLGAVNDNEDQAIWFATPRDGIRATVAHLLTYTQGPGPWTEHDPRASVTPARNQGAVKVLRDLEQKWAFTPWAKYNATPPDKRYGASIANLANALIALEVPVPPSKRLIDMYDHTPVIDRSQILTPAQIAKLNNFPHRKLRRFKYITFHETGNPNPGVGAQNHRDFVANGGGRHRVSYQWTVDDKEIIQITDVMEECVHAGSSVGNAESNAIEGCINSDGDFYRMLYNMAYLGAVLQRDHGVVVADKKQHNHWSGKNCPQLIRQRGLWDWLLQGVEDWRAKLDGPPTPTEREFPTGYTLKLGFLGLYESKEPDAWTVIGAPTGAEVPGVPVDDDPAATVQPTDVGWLLFKPTTGEIRMATKAQARQIEDELDLRAPGVDAGVVAAAADELTALATRLREAVKV